VTAPNAIARFPQSRIEHQNRHEHVRGRCAPWSAPGRLSTRPRGRSRCATASAFMMDRNLAPKKSSPRCALVSNNPNALATYTRHHRDDHCRSLHGSFPHHRAVSTVVDLPIVGGDHFAAIRGVRFNFHCASHKLALQRIREFHNGFECSFYSLEWTEVGRVVSIRSIVVVAVAAPIIVGRICRAAREYDRQNEQKKRRWPPELHVRFSSGG
jgi:hypothetical protein